ASLGGPDERREQKFATLVGDHFGMSPTNILLTRMFRLRQPQRNLFPQQEMRQSPASAIKN
ncbi:hypothetical protein B1692_15370, partial [Geobacillus thermoleovorans]